MQLTGSKNSSDESDKHILLAHTKTHITLSPLLPQQKFLYSTAESLAHTLRTSPFTLTLSQLITTGANEDSNFKYTAAVKGLKTQMQEASAALENVPGLADAMKGTFGDEEDVLGVFWRLVAEWYYHDLEGSWVGEDQRWCVD